MLFNLIIRFTNGLVIKNPKQITQSQT